MARPGFSPVDAANRFIVRRQVLLLEKYLPSFYQCVLLHLPFGFRVIQCAAAPPVDDSWPAPAGGCRIHFPARNLAQGENMKRNIIIIVLSVFVYVAFLQGSASAAVPPGFLHVDAEAGCVFGNAPHHWFKPSGDGMFFGFVFETDDADAQPVALEIVLTQAAYDKLPTKVKRFYHNHKDEIAMGEVTLPDLPADKAKETLDFLATTYGRMILITELADSGPHERTHIPTEARKYMGTFWNFTPK